MQDYPGETIYKGPSFSRLWEKSAIGTLYDGKGLILTDAEVVFCKEHRGVVFDDIFDQSSYSTWLAERVKKNPHFLREVSVLEALRVSGNKIVLATNFQSLELDAPGSWALRWTSDCHPSRDDPVSEIVWFHSDEKLHTGKPDSKSSFEWLLNWCQEVTQRGRFAEVLVIDDEQSVVTYRVSESDPRGSLASPKIADFKSINDMDSVSQHKGEFINDASNWPHESIGVPLHQGRQLDSVELQLIRSFFEGDSTKSFSPDKNVSPDSIIGDISDSARILLDLWSRGLNTRSGFKYGTTWRCYPGTIGEGHAPWLVVDPTKEGPSNWSEACLSSRLASGVNKEWIYPINDGNRWRYVQISRPPSDSRWSNPKRA